MKPLRYILGDTVCTVEVDQKTFVERLRAIWIDGGVFDMRSGVDLFSQLDEMEIKHDVKQLFQLFSECVRYRERKP